MKSQDAPDKIGYLPAEILTHKKTTDYIRWLVNPVVQNSNHFLADLKLLTEITA